MFGPPVEGRLEVVVPGVEWRWEIPEWSGMPRDHWIDSPTFKDKDGVDTFMTISIQDKPKGSKKDPKEGPFVGFYVTYKGDEIVKDQIKRCPKFTVALGNVRGRVMYQQSGHTIPPKVMYCGFGDAVPLSKMNACVAQSGYNVLTVWFRFWNDKVESTGNLGEWAWKIPNFPDCRIGPFCSNAFDRLGRKDRCCLELTVCKKDRSMVKLGLRRRDKTRSVPSTYRMTTGKGKMVLAETRLGDSDETIVPYGEILEKLREHNESTLIIYMEVHKNPGEKASPLEDHRRVVDVDDGEFCLVDGEKMSGRGAGSEAGSLPGDEAEMMESPSNRQRRGD